MADPAAPGPAHPAQSRAARPRGPDRPQVGHARALRGWAVTRTRELEGQPDADPAAYIARYDYTGQVLYYRPARCCDISSNRYNAAGTMICHPDAGYAANGDGRGADFLAMRTKEKL